MTAAHIVKWSGGHRVTVKIAWPSSWWCTCTVFTLHFLRSHDTTHIIRILERSYGAVDGMGGSYWIHVIVIRSVWLEIRFMIHIISLATVNVCR